MEAIENKVVDYIVFTSVDRDDIPDGGSGHFAETVKALKIKMAQLQQQQQQNNNQQLQQQLQQHSLSGQQLQNAAHNVQQDKIVGAGSVTGDGSMSNSFRGNDQVWLLFHGLKYVSGVQMIVSIIFNFTTLLEML